MHILEDDCENNYMLICNYELETFLLLKSTFDLLCVLYKYPVCYFVQLYDIPHSVWCFINVFFIIITNNC